MMTRIRHSILFCASLLFGMQSLAIGQNQFNPVTPTGLPYHIIINSNSITGVYNASQVEIGIFDGALCVGSGTGTINSGQTIDIVAWEGDPTYSLEGFTSGNPISIQLAVNEYGTNNIISADVSYSIGDGSFGYGSYSVAGVTGSIEAVPDIEVNPTLLAFGSLDIGETDVHSFMVKNLGSVTLSVNSISVPNGYSISTGTFNVAPDDSQQVWVTFSPNSATDYSGNIRINCNDPYETQAIVELTGQGLADLVPEMIVNPTSLAFGAMPVGNSESRNFTIRNEGSAVLNIYSVSTNHTDISAQYSSFALQPGEEQLIEVEFSPGVGSISGSVLILHNDSSTPSPYSVSVTGYGYDDYFSPVPETGLPYVTLINHVVLDDHSLPYGSQVGIFDGNLCVGSAVYLGAYPLQVTAWEADPGNDLAGFTQGDSITIKVRTTAYDSVTVINGDIDFSVGDGLFGTGSYSVISLNLESNLAPHLYALPSSLEFPLTATGEISAKTFTIYNTGATDLIVNGWNMDNSAFYTSTDVGRVNSGDSVEVQIFFSPPSGAWHQGNFYIYSNDPDNLTQVVQLSGAGVLSGQPVIHVPITNFNLGDVVIGETGTLAIQVFNTGNDTLTINEISSTNGAFQVPATPIQIPENSSIALDVSSLANAIGWFTTEIIINSNASNTASLQVAIQAYGYDAYFDPVAPTGEQYQIVVTDITDASGYGLDEGDEIGVFDGLQCVGVGVYHGSDSLSISTWEAIPDQSLPGYTDGNLIQFKYHLIDDDSNEHVFDIIPEFISGDGAFGTGIFSLVNLEIIDRVTPFEPYAGPVFYVSADSGLDYINNGSYEQPFRTIQHSINVVENADTILVRPGTYVENINFNGKNIVLSSLYTTTVDTSFISQTIIDGNQSGSVVTIVNGEDAAAELIGFTIRNGSGTYMAIGYGGKKGGGIRIVGSSPTISNCYIIENHVTENNGNGGGIFCYNDSDPTISDCIISNNTAAEKGPGIQLNTDCDPVITNCLFNSNIGEYGGGVHALFNSNPIISNCTFTNNTAGSYGGAIAIRSGSHVYLKNSILWNNSANRGDEIGLYGEEGTATIEANYSDIAGGQGAISEEVGNGTIIWGTGNIDTDPSFVGYGTGNFNLLASSLCINAGDPTTFDEDGTQSDMGAYPYTNSYSGPDWYVSIEGNDHTGTGSVSNPFASIQAGINAATTPGDSVSVAPGTYVENINFRGRSIKVFGEQGAENTIIDGDSSGSVVTFDGGEDSTSILVGLTIENGNGSGDGHAGGVFCFVSSPQLEHLIVQNNHGYQGGGISCYNNSSPILNNIIVRNNHASHIGGGLYTQYSSNPTVRNSLFYENHSAELNAGGMIFRDSSNPIISNTTIVNNGGGIYSSEYSNPIISNCIVWGNIEQIKIELSDLTISYSNVQDGEQGITQFNNSNYGWGIGNINLNPTFLDSANSDYRLHPISSCIDAGDPSSDFVFEPEPNGDRINMGAYGNTPEAAVAVLTLGEPETVATEDSLYSVNITLPPDSQVVFSYSLIEGPDWVNFDESLAHISGIPDNAYVGHNELQLSVSDNYNRNDTLIYDVVVANSQPSITSAADTIGTEDQLYYYNIESTDEGIGATKYQSLVLPIWLDLDSLSGELTGTPGDSAVGDTLVSIQFLDGNGGSDSQVFNLHIVNMNDAISIISIPDTTAIEDIEYVYEVQTLDDDLNDATRFNLNIAPYGMEIDSLTGRISWLPDNSSVGDTLVSFSVVDDSGSTDIQTYNLHVLNTNDAPLISSVPDTIATEDAPYTYQVVGEDVDLGDNIHYSLLTAPSGMQIDDSNGLITWTPTNDAVGDKLVMIVVSDDTAATDTQSFFIHVENVNDAPVVNNPLADFSVEEDSPRSTFALYDIFHDDDISSVNDSLSFQVAHDNQDLISAHTLNDSLHLNFLPDQNGIVLLQLTAFDLDSASVSEYVTITILPVNDAPEISSIDSTTATEDISFVYRAQAIDIDNESLNFSFENVPAWLTADSDSIYGTATEGIGDASFLLIVNDSELSDTLSVLVNVIPVNDPPLLSSISPITFEEDIPYYLNLNSLFNRVNDPDDHDSTLSWSFINTENIQASRSGDSVQVRNTSDWFGMENISVVVSDTALSDTTEWVITVLSIEDFPRITSIPDTVATEDRQYRFDIEAYDPDPGDSISFVLNEAPWDMTIDEQSGVIEWSPDNLDVGDTLVTFTVTDATNRSTSETFTLYVINANDAIQIVSFADTIALEDEEYLYAVATLDDDLNDQARFSLSIAPAGMSIDSLNGHISWFPTNENVGDTVVSFSVVDDSGSTDSQSYTLHVLNINDSPVISSTADTNATEDQAYSYAVLASDDDLGDNLVFSLLIAPQGMDINDSTGVISWLPDNGDVGDTLVTIIASDDSSAIDTQSFVLHIENVNDPPVIILDITDFIVAEDAADTSFALGEIFHDDDLYSVDDSLIFTLTNSQPGIVNASIARDTLFLDYLENQNGTVNLSITATDIPQTSATESFLNTITAVNDIPSSFNLITEDAIVFYDSVITFNWEASLDPDVLTNADQLFYTFRYSAVEDFSTYFDIEDISDTSLTLELPFVQDQTYYWKVRVEDFYRVKIWSDEVRSFSLNYEDNPPSIPVLLAPLTQAVLDTSSEIVWSHSTDEDLGDSVNYEFEFAGDDQFSGILATYSWTDTSVTLSDLSHAILNENALHYFRIRAYDNDTLYSSWSPVGSFYWDNVNETPDQVTSLFAPVDEVVTTLTPDFEWSLSTDIDPGDTDASLSYIASVWSVVDTFSFNTEPGDTIHTLLTDLSENEVYQWTVRALDDGGLYSVNSDTGSFWVNSVNESPLAFNLIEPLSDTLDTSYPTFSWQASTDPDINAVLSYTLRYSQSESFSTYSEVEGLGDTTHTLADSLADDLAYYWKVRVSDEFGLSRWSDDSFSFYVNAIPNLPPTAHWMYVDSIMTGVTQVPYFYEDLDHEEVFIEFEYSTNAGSTWQFPTQEGLFREESLFSWNTLADLPDWYGAVWLRITPSDDEATGTGDILITAVDNIAPEVSISNIPADQSGEVDITYLANNDTYSPTNIYVSYRTSITASWTMILSDHFMSEPVFENGVAANLTWYSEMDLNGYVGDEIQIRVMASDYSSSSEDVSNPFSLNNNHDPTITITPLVGWQSDIIDVHVEYGDTENDALTFNLYFSLDGSHFIAATTEGGALASKGHIEAEALSSDKINMFAPQSTVGQGSHAESGSIKASYIQADGSSADGIQLLLSSDTTLNWYSQTDLPVDYAGEVWLRATVYDAFSDVISDTITCQVDNNLPELSIEAITGEVSGIVPITVHLDNDSENDVTITGEYKIFGSSTWNDMVFNGQVSGGTETIEIAWNSIEDLGVGSNVIIDIRMQAGDGQGIGSYAYLNLVQVDNNELPVISSLQVVPTEPRGDIPIQIYITDAENDILTYQCQYSLNSGADYYPTTSFSISGDYVTSGYQTITWQSFDDVVNTVSSQMRFRVTPSDNDAGASATSSTFTIFNSGGPQFDMVLNTDYPNLLWQDTIKIKFNRAMDGSTAPDGIELSSDAQVMGFDYLMARNDTVINIIPQGAYPPDTQVQIKLTAALLDHDGYAFDGNRNSVPDGSLDDRIISLQTPKLADYDFNGVLNEFDLLEFVLNWNLPIPDLSMEIGPSYGELPYPAFYPDGLFDYEDLMVFIATWKWNKNQGGLARGIKWNPGQLTPVVKEELSVVVNRDHELDLNIDLKIPEDLDITMLRYHIEGLDSTTNVSSGYLSSRFEETIRLEGDGAEFIAGLTPKTSTDQQYRILSINSCISERTEINIQITAWDSEGEQVFRGSRLVEVDPVDYIPREFSLDQNFPNPFNGSTTISYAIPDETHVSMILYDIRGRMVRTLLDKNQTPGYYQIKWNGLSDDQLGLGAGIYLCRIQAGSQSQIIKMVYLK